VHAEDAVERGWFEVSRRRLRAEVAQRLRDAATDAPSRPGDERDAAFDAVQSHAYSCP